MIGFPRMLRVSSKKSSTLLMSSTTPVTSLPCGRSLSTAAGRVFSARVAAPRRTRRSVTASALPPSTLYAWTYSSSASSPRSGPSHRTLISILSMTAGKRSYSTCMRSTVDPTPPWWRISSAIAGSRLSGRSARCWDFRRRHWIDVHVSPLETALLQPKSWRKPDWIPLIPGSVCSSIWLKR